MQFGNKDNDPIAAALSLLGGNAESELYKPVNMRPEQIQAESGGRQTDKSGKVLVGRRGNGQLPSVNERAYGTAQIQIGTAKATAAKHGIPWDESKLMNDADYNLRLGDLHKGDLLAYYKGDNTLATAAYHSGTGNVDRAIRTHGRSAFYKGLGPDGRAYVAKLTGEGGAGGVKQGGKDMSAAMPQVDPAPVADAAKIQAMGKGENYEIVDPFAAEVMGQLKSRVREGDKRAVSADDVLSQSIAIIQSVQDMRKEQLGDIVAEKQIINTQRLEASQATLDRATPLLAQQEDLRRRKAELSRMNPIARFFKGIADPKSNPVILREEEALVQSELKSLGDRYETTRQLTNNVLQDLNAIDSDNASLLGLEAANAAQDIQLAGQSYASAQTMIGSMTSALGIQSNVDSMQEQARARFMSRMDEGQVNAALAAADANGGITTLNGAPVYAGELRELSMGWENKRMGLAGARMANQMGQLQLEGAYHEQTIRAMTPQERIDALANGGSYQGQQLPVDKLATAVQNDQMSNSAGAMKQAPLILADTLTALGGSMKASAAQSQHLMGYIPPALQATYDRAQVKLQAITSQMKEANARGQGTSMAATLLPQVQEIMAEQQKVVTESAKAWAGGNKSIERVAVSWMTGQPISASDSANAVVSMARGGIPAGTSFSPAANKLFKQIEGHVKGWDSQHQGKNANDAQLIRNVSSMIASQYNNESMNNVFLASPRLAKHVKVGDKLHPLSRIDQDDFIIATREGEKTGLAAIATQHDLQPAELITLITKGPGHQGVATKLKAAGKNDTQIARLQTDVVVAQTQAMMEFLDKNFASDEFRPSRALADLMNNPEYQKLAHKSHQGMGNQSFTDTLISGAAGNGFGMNLANFTNVVTQSAQAVRATELRNSATIAHEMNRNPLKRAAFILGAVDGISKNEEKLFLDYMAKTLKTNGVIGDESMMYEPGMRGFQQQRLGQTLDAMEAIVLGGKLADPTLESIRRRAATDWKTISAQADRGFDRVYGK